MRSSVTVAWETKTQKRDSVTFMPAPFLELRYLDDVTGVKKVLYFFSISFDFTTEKLTWSKYIIGLLLCMGDVKKNI